MHNCRHCWYSTHSLDLDLFTYLTIFNYTYYLHPSIVISSIVFGFMGIWQCCSMGTYRHPNPEARTPPSMAFIIDLGALVSNAPKDLHARIIANVWLFDSKHWNCYFDVNWLWSMPKDGAHNEQPTIATNNTISISYLSIIILLFYLLIWLIVYTMKSHFEFSIVTINSKRIPVC